MVNNDGSSLAADAKADFVNYPIDSLFQQVNVLFNGNLTISSLNTSSYRAMLEVLSGYDQGAKNLTMELYIKDSNKDVFGDSKRC